MIRRLKKIFKILRPQLLDVLVYRYDLSQPPGIAIPQLTLTISVEQPHHNHIIYIFNISCNEHIVNKNYVYRQNLLAKQLGFKDALLLGNSETMPSYQGKGIQSYALAYILNFLSEKGHTFFHVFVFPHNSKMIHVLEKLKGIRIAREKYLGYLVYPSIKN